MNSWRNCQLGDVLELKRGYDLPASQRIEGGYPIVSSSGITGTHVEAKVKGPGVVTGRYGTLGEVFFLPGDFWPLNTSLYVRDFKGNEPRFVSYFLMSLDLGGRNAAGAVPGVNRNHLHQLEVTVPSVIVQRRIASILSTYDDLIENNARRIAILEEMARRLYEEWFVNFRFPGHDGVVSDDSLPMGWRRGPISDLYQGLYDGPHATPKPSDEGPVFLGIGNLTESGRLDLADVRHIAEEDFGHWTKRVSPQAGDIVFTYEATLNRYAIIPRGFRGCLGRRLALIRVDPKASSNLFLYCMFFSPGWREIVAQNTLSGATVDRIPLSKFPQFTVTIPPPEVISRFDDLVRPMLAQTERLNQKNANLRAQRDLLLPKLISGEIDVAQVALPEAEADAA